MFLSTVKFEFMFCDLKRLTPNLNYEPATCSLGMLKECPTTVQGGAFLTAQFCFCDHDCLNSSSTLLSSPVGLTFGSLSWSEWTLWLNVFAPPHRLLWYWQLVPQTMEDLAYGEVTRFNLVRTGEIL